MRLVLLAALLTGFAPQVNAALSCADFRYGSDDYRANMGRIAKQASLPHGAYSKYHERIVNDVCQDDADDIKKMVDLGYVNSSEVGSIQRVLKSQDRSAKVATQKPASQAGPGDLAAMTGAINAAFMQWSRQWVWDRYIPDSTSISEDRLKNGVYLLRGTFRFTRGGSIIEIPYASAIQGSSPNWTVASLCYNDTSSGITDCANSGTSAGARQFMGAVVLAGVMSALSSTGSSAHSSDEDHNQQIFDRIKDEERRRQDDQHHVEESARTDAWYRSLSEPNPMLLPEKHVNDD